MQENSHLGEMTTIATEIHSRHGMVIWRLVKGKYNLWSVTRYYNEDGYSMHPKQQAAIPCWHKTPEEALQEAEAIIVFHQGG